MDHFLFVCRLIFDEAIGSVVLIEPDSTESFFIDSDHGLGNVKPSKTIVQSLESHDTFFEQIEALSKSHFINVIQFQGAMLVVNL